MNELLQSYVIDTEHLNVSGIEFLQMLRTRSQLLKFESGLTPEEKRALVEADRRLASHAAEVVAELSRFIDLAEERRRLQPRPTEWWWYLDVLVQAPTFPTTPRQPEAVTA